MPAVLVTAPTVTQNSPFLFYLRLVYIGSFVIFIVLSSVVCTDCPCLQEMGGYFILNGIERVVRMLIMQRRNFVCITASDDMLTSS